MLFLARVAKAVGLRALSRWLRNVEREVAGLGGSVRRVERERLERQRRPEADLSVMFGQW